MVFCKLCCSQNESSFKTMKFNISIYLCKVWYRKDEGKGARSPCKKQCPCTTQVEHLIHLVYSLWLHNPLAPSATKPMSKETVVIMTTQQICDGGLQLEAKQLVVMDLWTFCGNVIDEVHIPWRPSPGLGALDNRLVPFSHSMFL